MKQNIGAMIMTFLLVILIMFGMRSCTQGSGDNFGHLDFSLAGNEVRYDQVENQSEIKEISGNTDLVDFKFTTESAALSSYQIKSQKDETKKIELVLSHDEKLPFRIFWGNDRRNPDKAIYQYSNLSTETQQIHQFNATILDNDKLPVNIIKTYTLLNDSYMWTLNVEFKTEGNRIPNIGESGYSYSVYYGPQMGPKYEKLSKKNAQYAEERLIHENYINKKGKVESKNLMRSEIIANSTTESDGLRYYVERMDNKKMNWVALTGKYFLFIADIPQQTSQLFYASDSVSTTSENASMVYENEFFLAQASFNENNLKATNSKFYFYMGPRNSGVLKESQQSFGRTDLDFSPLASKGFLGLNVIIEKLIGFINYTLNVNNWGWSIIIFTILLKIALFGLTTKSSKSMSKMQEIGPKMTELREKYKDDPQGLQAATALLYKSEGVNPMGGCLPLLIQMPILIAIYSFINNSYEMKGEPFVGWITDLSVPDAIFSFSSPLPLLGWTSLNLLPIIYIATQMFSTIMMRPKKQKSTDDTGKKKSDPQQTQMLLMQYGMPLIFFFVLYSAPSGLFVYWITMNLFTILQQYYFNKFIKNKPDKKGEKNSASNKIKKGPQSKGNKIKNA